MADLKGVLLKSAGEIGRIIGENPRKVQTLVNRHHLPAVYHNGRWQAVASRVVDWLPGYLDQVGAKVSAVHHRHENRRRKMRR